MAEKGGKYTKYMENNDSEESDDGVKEGDRPTYIGECDAENRFTNPEIRKRFKREKRQRLKEIQDLKQRACKVREKSVENKRLRRKKKRKEREDEVATADNNTLEDRLSEMFQKKQDRIMRKMIQTHDDGFIIERNFFWRVYRESRMRSGEIGDWVSDFNAFVDHEGPMGKFEFLLLLKNYKEKTFGKETGGKRERQFLQEQMMIMIAEDESSSETTDNSELEEIESEMYKKSYLNMRINDLIDMNAVKDQFEKKIMLGDANTAERLLQLHPGIQEDTHFISAMVYQAASSKSISCLKTLFRIGAHSSRPSLHPDNHGKTPLHIACEKDHLDVVVTLIQHKAKIDKRDNNGNTPLLTAMEHGACKRIIEMIEPRTEIKLTKHINNKGYGLLNFHGPWYGDIRTYTSTRSNADALDYVISAAEAKGESEALLSHVAPDTMNPPLFQALATHNTENAKLLIQRGADINYRHANPPNIQPIHVVARMRSASIMELLLNNGAIPDSRDSNGHTVLRHLFRPYLEHFMHDRDIIECCMVLAQHGANINEHLSSSGDTPFHITAQFAARFELNDHVIKLLRMGGNPHIENWYYKLTPYEISKRSRDPSLKAVMDNYVLHVKSLTECCKWVIRQSMGEHGSIYTTAWKLPLPKHLIKFIIEVNLDINEELEEAKTFERPLLGAQY